MPVRVKGYLVFKDLVGELIIQKTAGETLTLQVVLQRLCSQKGQAFEQTVLDSSGNLQNSIAILVNGRHYKYLPGKLETELEEGDEVAIFPPLAGG
ncbi:MAG: MoaD family protein [Anaerolineales bacterium]|jgi:molybdopterin synthase sulfur carrier subunit